MQGAAGGTATQAVKRCRASLLLALWLGTAVAGSAPAAESLCRGSVAKGSLEHGVKLPEQGPNFTTYSTMAASLGRTYVHSSVAQVVLAAYAGLETSAPGKHYVYGETGWAKGGRIQPHRTHQNGLSVDFMVPVVDEKGRSVPLPTHAGNKFGYAIEFDAQGRYQNLSIDFEALAEHLYQLDRAAKQHKIGLALVIIDPPYVPKLFATRRGAWLRTHLGFMKRSAWVRHDEHYHVDFAVPCKPLQKAKGAT